MQIRRKVALVGGGYDIINLYDSISQINADVEVFLAPRHANEMSGGQSFKSLLESKNVCFTIVDSENAFASELDKNCFDIVFGLGPAWIFKDSTLAKVQKWFNINIIPFPKYMGGAHSTWQILHNNYDGAVVIQEITKEIDRGRIIARSNFTYGENENTPQLRLARNSREISTVFQTIQDLVRDKHLDYVGLNNLGESEYWPRLNTHMHGWINWAWTAQEISRFVYAFSIPYPGAHTRLGDTIVYFEDASIESYGSYHPFSSGIIVRKITTKVVIVAAKDALLRVKCFSPIEEGFIEGLRFYTDVADLEIAMKKHLGSKDLH